MEAFANEGGMIPEQIWDNSDIPDLELYLGKPSGAAMPLIWAHAEYIKLCRSIKRKQVFDRPLQTSKRYLVEKTVSAYSTWSFNNKRSFIPAGKILRIEVKAAAEVRWTKDKWKTIYDTSTKDTDLGMHLADIPTKDLPPGRKIQFTFHWREVDKWENVDFVVRVDKN